jgi:alkylation response protein AidB-like acyl-CoA dehydrogenase
MNMHVNLGEPNLYDDIREEVYKLCAGFDGEYWRKLDRDAAYPAEFVQALTNAGYLAALIPEDYGGSGLPLSAAAAILEEIQRAGCNGAACHAQMYIMGALLRHGNETQKRAYLPKIASGELRLQAFAVTEPTSGTDTTSLKTYAELKGLDLARRALGLDASPGAHHAQGSGCKAHGRIVRFHYRYA